MSEQILRFLLSELTVVRLRCLERACDSVVELPIARLSHSSFSKGYACPVCGATLLKAGENYLEMLGQAVQGLSQARKRIHVEFTLPQPPQE